MTGLIGVTGLTGPIGRTRAKPTTAQRARAGVKNNKRPAKPTVWCGALVIGAAVVWPLLPACYWRAGGSEERNSETSIETSLATFWPTTGWLTS